MKSRLFSRLVLLVAVTIAAAAIISSATRFSYLPTQPPPVQAPLPQKLASYVGVYEAGAPPSYQPVTEFARTACPPGKPPNLVGYYSGWAEPFQTSFAEQIHAQAPSPTCRSTPPRRRCRGSPTVSTTSTCAPTPTACGISATRSSSASATR
jgi:hypothetical protein